MAFLDFLKKKKVPEELPDLVTDEIEKKMKEDIGDSEGSSSDDFSKEVVSNDDFEKNSKKEKADQKRKDSEGESNYSSKENGEDEQKDYASELKRAVLHPKEADDHSFFKEFKKDLSEELANAEHMEEWYNKELVSKDILGDMKKYWESQKTTSALNALGEEFKERINDKTELLEKLEKEWQNTYFELVEKEGQIKDEEEELKKMLSEFMELYKRRKNHLKNNGPKKTREKHK